jgi:hypothetical protein
MEKATVLEVQQEKNCSSCGKEGHANARSKACLNNKKAKNALLAAESGEIQTSFEDEWRALGEPDE